MKFWLVSYLGTGVVMLVIDAVWLSTMGKLLYRPILGDILLDGFRLAPAAVFYFLYVAAIVVFAVAPAAMPSSLLFAELPFHQAAMAWATSPATVVLLVA